MKIFRKSLACILSLLLLATSLVSCGVLGSTTDINESLGVVSSDILSTSVEVSNNDTSETLREEPTSEETTSQGADNSGFEISETSEEESKAAIDEDGVYTTADDVALYIFTYKKLPDNFITKNEARSLGWEGGGLDTFAPGKCIGGDRFGNYEGLLPEKNGRFYTECDIDTLGEKSRGAKRIVFSNDGLVYYTDDHYESFTLLYGEER